MSSAKEKASMLLNSLPDQVSWDHILNVLRVKKEIEQGLNIANENKSPSECGKKTGWFKKQK